MGDRRTVCDDFLGVACGVCRAHRENHYERCVVRAGQVVRDESSGLVVGVEEC